MNCKNCKKQWCFLAGKNHEMSFECNLYVGKTNADRIRSMTDEELAEYFAQCACSPIRFNKNTGDIVCPVNKEPSASDCKSCWLDWLKEEAKDD